MPNYELGVIGGGNMAGAMLRGALAGGFAQAGTIIVSEPLAQRRQAMSRELEVMCVADNMQAADCPRVLLAVKPQVMSAVLEEIRPRIRPRTLVVSIAAGISTRAIDQALSGAGRIVRVMPNTPMLVGEGMSAIAAGPRAVEADVKWVEGFCAASGRTCIVDEAVMDAVTAVSGSGPAYFFYLVEAMVAAGVAEGLSEQTALALAAQTCLGAGKLLIQSDKKPEVLRAGVTSPGGTTQRAVETLDAAGVKDTLVKAIRAAAQRSRELGK